MQNCRLKKRDTRKIKGYIKEYKTRNKTTR